MDPTNSQRLAEKDREIASLTQAYVELKDKHTKLTEKYNKLTDKNTELTDKYDSLNQKNASLEAQVARLGGGNPPAHTVSDTSTLRPNTADTTPPPRTAAPIEENTAWGSQSPSYDPAWATGQEPHATLLNDGGKARNKFEQYKAGLKQEVSPVTAVFKRIGTNLSDVFTHTFRRKQEQAVSSEDWQQDPADPSNGWPEESAPTGWDQSGPSSEWDQAPGVVKAKEEPKWRSLKQPPKTTTWLHGRHWLDADLMDGKKLGQILDQHALVPATRLNDGDWAQSELQDILVDDKYLFDLATRGKEIAQYIVWDHARKNCPSVLDQYWPAGPHQVKLEFVAMTDAVGSGNRFFVWLQNDPQKARDLLLYRVVNLRHMVAHWDHLQGRKTPQLVATRLEEVQKFAITMGNYECAMEARMLRDDLWQAVKDTVPEVEELDRVADTEDLSPTFEAREYKVHHLQMFQQIEESKKWTNPEDHVRFPGIIHRAAAAWAWRRDEAWHIPEGEEQKNKADKEDAKTRRRDSFSGRTARPVGELGLKRRGSSST